MARRESKLAIADRREAKCRKWAKEQNIVECLTEIMKWAKSDEDQDTEIALLDWVNNIIWYSKMDGINTVDWRVISGKNKNG